MSTPQRHGEYGIFDMNEMKKNAIGALRALEDKTERLLMSDCSFLPGAGLTIYRCYGFSQFLASRACARQSLQHEAEAIWGMADECGEEIAEFEKVVEHAGGWYKRRLVPTEFDADELALRSLHRNIGRYLDALEPEYIALPVHELSRLLQRVKLLEVWDVRAPGYQPDLRAASKALQRARDAAEYATRN